MTGQYSAWRRQCASVWMVPFPNVLLIHAACARIVARLASAEGVTSGSAVFGTAFSLLRGSEDTQAHRSVVWHQRPFHLKLARVSV